MLITPLGMFTSVADPYHAKKPKIYFSGLAGTGVSALACFLADRGYTVFGSDRIFDQSPSHPLMNIMKAKGIRISRQNGSGIDRSISLFVISSAIEQFHPEIRRARELGLPIRKRAEILSELTSFFRTVAVTGTSGKSTTSGLLAYVMKTLRISPNLIGGGKVKQFIAADHPGNYLSGSSSILIVEACESEDTISHYCPEHLIILNLALDHHRIETTAKWLKNLILQTSGKVLLNADDDNLMSIASAGAVMFSLQKEANYKAERIVYGPFGTEFTLLGRRFFLSLPGRHNLYNAVASITLLQEMGVITEEITDIVAGYSGIERRFDVHLDMGEYLVIDDYAHNPHKISFLMETVKRMRERLCFIFQPHGFGPTRLMKDDYISVFGDMLRETDILVMLPIYYAGGTVSKDVSSNDITAGVIAAGKSAVTMSSRDRITELLPEYKAFAIFGARDDTLGDFARDIAIKLTPLR